MAYKPHDPAGSVGAPGPNLDPFTKGSGSLLFPAFQRIRDHDSRRSQEVALESLFLVSSILLDSELLASACDRDTVDGTSQHG